jgi:hypothetical protein
VQHSLRELASMLAKQPGANGHGEFELAAPSPAKKRSPAPKKTAAKHKKR